MSRLIQPVSSFGIENLAKTDFKDIILSVVVSGNGLSFLAFAENRLLAFEIFNFTGDGFQDIISASSFAAKNYNHVEIVIENRFFTLVPENSVTEVNKLGVMETLFGIDNHDVFIQKSVKQDVVFAFDKNIKDIIVKQWQNVRFTHFAKILLENYNSIKKEGETVFYHILDKYFWSALFSGDKPVLFNSYEFSGKNDFGFFALGIIKNSGFDNRNVKVCISGKIAVDAPLMELLNKYLPDVSALSFDNIPREFTEFQHIIKHIQK